MENYPLIKNMSRSFQETSVKRSMPDNNPVKECRSLVRVLAKKTETLYRECRHDQDKASHIRAMGTALAALTVLVNRLDEDSGTIHTPEILKDARGIIYESVRSCELNRICDK
ncbi:MAG: hypothetical protein Q7T80_09450 [Methanoregula sp.]|nr:hypothetical protein [Methanoregula sp.]